MRVASTGSRLQLELRLQPDDDRLLRSTRADDADIDPFARSDPVNHGPELIACGAMSFDHCAPILAAPGLLKHVAGLVQYVCTLPFGAAEARART